MRPLPFFEILTPPSPTPRGQWTPQWGKGHVGRHCPYTYTIWRGFVHTLLRYRSKTAKMQKFPIDSYSNENFISPFFRPPGAPNPQKGRRHIRNQSTPACKLWRESACGLSRNRWPNKKNKQKTYSKTNTSLFTLTSEWQVITRNQNAHLQGNAAPTGCTIRWAILTKFCVVEAFLDSFA